MKTRMQRLAPLGLILAGLAALASIGLFIVQREFTLALQISLGLVVIGLALYVILDPERVRQALTGRQAKYGSNAILFAIAFIGILVVINYLVFKNPKRWDLTESQQYTLSPETIDTIKSMPEPVKFLAFYTAQLSTDSTRALLDQYKYHSDGNIDYEFIDPNTDQILAQQYKVIRDGTIVAVMGQNQEQVTLTDESEITSALVRLLSPGTRAVYFLTGHGEFELDYSDTGSYSGVKQALEAKNYTVNPLNLVATGNIPEDAQVIVIPGPLKPLSQTEVDLLKAYVESGGGLVVMEEPLLVTQFGEDPDPLADYLGETWGIILGKDMVVDLSSSQNFVAVSSQYGDSIITEKLQGLLTFYPTTRSVTADQTVTAARLIELVLTSDQSWAETDLAALQAIGQGQENAPEIQPDEGVDLTGPVSIAVTAEDSSSSARLVVFGDSEFASDTYFTQYGNGDMMVNSVDWAAEQEGLISLTPKDNIERLMIPPGRYTMNLILLGVVFILPGLVLLAGILVWLQRRQRG